MCVYIRVYIIVGSNNLRPWPISTLGLKARAEKGYGRGWVIKVQIVLRHSRGWFCPRHIRGLTGEKGKNGIGIEWKKSKISRSIEKGTLDSITTKENCPYCHSILCAWQSHTLQLLQPPPTTRIWADGTSISLGKVDHTRGRRIRNTC